MATEQWIELVPDTPETGMTDDDLAPCPACDHPASEHDSTGECGIDYCQCGWTQDAPAPAV